MRKELIKIIIIRRMKLKIRDFDSFFYKKHHKTLKLFYLQYIYNKFVKNKKKKLTLHIIVPINFSPINYFLILYNLLLPKLFFLL
jgi:hypothetical protein